MGQHLPTESVTYNFEEIRLVFQRGAAASLLLRPRRAGEPATERVPLGLAAMAAGLRADAALRRLTVRGWDPQHARALVGALAALGVGFGTVSIEPGTPQRVADPGDGTVTLAAAPRGPQAGHWLDTMTAGGAVVLIGLLLPAVQSVRERPSRAN